MPSKPRAAKQETARNFAPTSNPPHSFFLREICGKSAYTSSGFFAAEYKTPPSDAPSHKKIYSGITTGFNKITAARLRPNFTGFRLYANSFQAPKGSKMFFNRPAKRQGYLKEHDLDNGAPPPKVNKKRKTFYFYKNQRFATTPPMRQKPAETCARAENFTLPNKPRFF